MKILTANIHLNGFVNRTIQICTMFEQVDLMIGRIIQKKFEILRLKKALLFSFSEKSREVTLINDLINVVELIEHSKPTLSLAQWLTIEKNAERRINKILQQSYTITSQHKG